MMIQTSSSVKCSRYAPGETWQRFISAVACQCLRHIGGAYADDEVRYLS